MALLSDNTQFKGVTVRHQNINQNINNTSVVFIPAYLVSALQANGISLADFEALALSGAELSTGLGKVSMYDLVDLYVANNQLAQTIFGTSHQNGRVSDYINYTLYSYLYSSYSNKFQEAYVELINTLSTGASILVSDNNNNKSFTFENGEHTLFVILHAGFSDIAVGNDNVNRDAFVRELVDKVFQSYGEQAGIINMVTRSFIGKTMHNRIGVVR